MAKRKKEYEPYPGVHTLDLTRFSGDFMVNPLGDASAVSVTAYGRQVALKELAVSEDGDTLTIADDASAEPADRDPVHIHVQRLQSRLADSAVRVVIVVPPGTALEY